MNPKNNFPIGCSCGGRCAVSRTASDIVVTTEVVNFLEAGMTSPNSIVLLRQDTPLTPDEVRRLALALGGVKNTKAFGEVREISYDPNSTKSTALSLEEHPLHTDASFEEEPPSQFLLSFSQSDHEGGGESVFIKIADILAAAPEEVITALYKADCQFSRDDDGGFTDTYTGHILNRDENGRTWLRWRYDKHVKPIVLNAHGTDAQAAVEWVARFLETHPPIRYSAQSGETLLIPNKSILHGRTELSKDSRRTVYRAWVA